MDLPVRRANKEDFPQIADVLAKAFSHDPVAMFAFPEESMRETRLRRFFNLQLRYHYGPRGEIYTTVDNVGAVMWLPPRRIEPTVRDVIIELPLFIASVTQSAVMLRLARVLGAHHPRVPHYYLGTIAVSPRAQRRGVGTVLVQPVLDHCDQTKMPIYLESSSEQNNEFYTKLGFDVVNEIAVPRNGPPIWLMWRDPKPSAPTADL